MRHIRAHRFTLPIVAPVIGTITGAATWLYFFDRSFGVLEPGPLMATWFGLAATLGALLGIVVVLIYLKRSGRIFDDAWLIALASGVISVVVISFLTLHGAFNHYTHISGCQNQPITTGDYCD